MSVQEAKESKFINYLLYAIGEIVLVVVGILLALQINNASERRKNDEVVENILKQIHTDLKDAIAQADQAIGDYMEKNELIRKFMTDQVQRTDFEGANAWNLASVTTSLISTTIQTESFQSLLNVNDRLSPKYDSVLVALKNLYVDKKSILDIQEDYIYELTVKHIDWLKENTSWFSNFYTIEITEAQIDFYLTSEYYKNILTEYYQIGVSNHYRNLIIFRSEAIAVHDQITQLLELGTPYTYDTDQYTAYLGTFIDQSDTAKVLLEADALIVEISGIQGKIIPIDSSRFSVDFGGFFALERDSLNQVTGVTFQYGIQVYPYRKVDYTN